MLHDLMYPSTSFDQKDLEGYPQLSLIYFLPLSIISIPPGHPKVEDKLAWVRAIRSKNPTATTVFTDGSGANGKTAGGAITDQGATTWGEIHPSKATYLGKMASVADGERTGIANALQLHPNTKEVTILTDSLTALTTTMNLSKGHPPRSQIEKVISTHLHRRHEAGHTTTISWVKGHAGVPGNEAADKLVGEESAKGKGSPTITQEGIRAFSRRKLEKHRSREGFGKDRYKWGNQALAAYTWCRSNKGPQRSWLHKIGKAPNPDCPECGEEETGEHIVFKCPGHHQERRKLGEVREWKDLDKPMMKGEEGNRYDAVEDFFYYCHQRMSRRH